ncbi:hypothetical protein BD324DRAFT_640943 [Kockovaella imperatae]|uniref:RING-type domain-containing protein n=1 Tax=Kockovaella imperatae TaxID=4999 RepID=A0A1Y1UQF0_9TREE|nr:hypothetical protein BD324DRAFT_640943 [Kockovaella imperatae]ORX39787.1 hypothetical protein BD324DRAFT_640943 [Kockovaella imperatae]
MGNTSSHEGSGAPTPGNNGQPSTSTHPSSGSTPTVTARPIPTSSSGAHPAPGGFHSGLTPPPRTPSPPPPSTPPLLPYGGHLSPQNPHALALPQAMDYSKTIVSRLVMEARLAPFYRGIEDYEEDFTEVDIGRILDEVRQKDLEENVQNSVVEHMKFEREGSSKVGTQVVKKIGIHKGRDHKHEEERDEAYRREKRAYLGAVECPICFLNYPPNINTTRCCQQPICTECFVQIKRSEATITHLESDPASCPFCVETDFGVIYERPPLPSSSSLHAMSPPDGSALSISPSSPPGPELQGGLSQALTSQDEDAELGVGIGMNPKAQETIRRKSVSSKAKEVVLIDEIRPDWERKLNAVKAAAARKAARRVVMRQVGDRLIPIGYTSARAPGTADFSSSAPASGQRSGSGSGSSTPSRRDRRRTGSRGRDLEELMIMEAMRLSLIDHEEHQRKQDDEIRNGTPGPGSSSAIIIQGPQSRRVSDPHGNKEKTSTASKLFSKIGGRSRSGSAASSLKHVTFSASNPNLPGPSRSPNPGSVTPNRSTTPPSGSVLSSPVVPSSGPSPTTILPSSPLSSTQVNSASLSRSPPKSMSPSTGAPVAPITTLTNANQSKGPAVPAKNPPPPQALDLPTPINQPHSSILDDAPAIPAPLGHSPMSSSRISQDGPAGLPRLSLDMPTLTPDHPRSSTENTSHFKGGVGFEHEEESGSGSVAGYGVRPGMAERTETGLSTIPSERNYAALDSDEEV